MLFIVAESKQKGKWLRVEAPVRGVDFVLLVTSKMARLLKLHSAADAHARSLSFSASLLSEVTLCKIRKVESRQFERVAPLSPVLSARRDKGQQTDQESEPLSYNPSRPSFLSHTDTPRPTLHIRASRSSVS